MKYLTLLLLVSQASATTINYQFDPGNGVYVQYYPTPKSGGLYGHWDIGDGQLSASLDSETGEFTLDGYLTAPFRFTEDPVWPNWMYQPVSIHAHQTFSQDNLTDHSLNQDEGFYTTAPNYNLNIVSDTGLTLIDRAFCTSSCSLRGNTNLSSLSLNLTDYAVIEGAIIEMGITGGLTRIEERQALAVESDAPIHNPEPASLLLSLLGLPFLKLKLNRAN